MNEFRPFRCRVCDHRTFVKHQGEVTKFLQFVPAKYQFIVDDAEYAWSMVQRNCPCVRVFGNGAFHEVVQIRFVRQVENGATVVVFEMGNPVINLRLLTNQKVDTLPQVHHLFCTDKGFPQSHVKEVPDTVELLCLRQCIGLVLVQLHGGHPLLFVRLFQEATASHFKSNEPTTHPQSHSTMN